MLSPLAFIDWAALLIALVLLGIAAAATYLSHITANDVIGSHDSNSRNDLYEGIYSLPPAHAASDLGPLSEAPKPPILRSRPKLESPAHEAAPFTAPVHAQGDESVSAQPVQASSFRTAESVAERAARIRRRKKVRVRVVPEGPALDLRSRTTPVPERAGGVSASEDPGDVLYGAGSNKLSVGMASADGFSPRNPGFFDDPIGRHELRYWDGRKWTEYVKEGEDRFIDPL